jgi:hypothetical protein
MTGIGQTCQASIRVEAFGDLHEFGKLGKLVTAKEAAALVQRAATPRTFCAYRALIAGQPISAPTTITLI